MARGRSLFIAAGAAGLLMVTFAVAGLIFVACSSAPTPAPSTVPSAAPPATVSVPPSTAPSAAPPATSSVAPGVGAVGANSQLGKAIFFDKNLSLNRNLSCASCHDPAVGFTGPDSLINLHGAVYEGSIAGAFGNSKPPSSAYTTMSPKLHLDATMGWVGGNFWDGRATGAKLGNPAADQAQGPFLNPKEQALPDSACVVYRVFTGPQASTPHARPRAGPSPSPPWTGRRPTRHTTASPSRSRPTRRPPR
jgi:cytochrome c peroxidase